MKKILFLMVGAIPFLLTGCNNAGTTTESKETKTMADQNLAAFRTVVEAFEKGDISKIDSVVAPDFIDHTDQGDKGRDSLKAMIQTMHTQMPDMKSEAVRELADDDYVFGLLRYTGTSDGKMGMPAGPFDFKTLEVVKFKDGKAVEHWAYMEPREMMKMMPPMPKEEGKKK